MRCLPEFVGKYVAFLQILINREYIWEGWKISDFEGSTLTLKASLLDLW